MHYICRKLEEKVSKYAEYKTEKSNVLLIAGARQVGKSTMLENIFPKNKHLWLNLARDAGFTSELDQTSNIDEFKFLLENKFSAKIGNHNKVIIIDEGQLSTKLGGYIRFIKEEWKNQKFIVTGSTLSTLFDKHPYPTGRVTELILRPFDFLEYLDSIKNQAMLELIKKNKIDSILIHQKILQELQNYLLVGGLPGIVEIYNNNKTKEEYLEFLKNIFGHYKRDFHRHFNIENAGDLFDTIYKKLAATSGSNIKLSTIVSTNLPAYKKLPGALELLESWNQVIKINIELSKLSKTLTVTPKRYLFDHGIRSLQHLDRFSSLDITNSQDLNREDLGGIIENFVLTELLALENIDISSWQKTHQSNEVDFVFNYNGTQYACEVKSSLKNNRNHCRNLIDFHKYHPNSKLLLLNLAPSNTFKFDNNVTVKTLPVYMIQQHLLNEQ